MSASYLFSPAAQNDLGGIWDYTVRTWGIAQAEHYVRSIHAACVALAEARTQGRAVDDIRRGYKKLAVGSHLLFYRLTESGKIEVIRILHQRMDVVGKLQGN